MSWFRKGGQSFGGVVTYQENERNFSGSQAIKFTAILLIVDYFCSSHAVRDHPERFLTILLATGVSIRKIFNLFA